MDVKKHTILQTALLYTCLLLCFLSGGCGKAKEPAPEGSAEALPGSRKEAIKLALDSDFIRSLVPEELIREYCG